MRLFQKITILYHMIFSQSEQADFVASPVSSDIQVPRHDGKNIRIFHIEIIYLIGGNITAVMVIILTKSTFELLFLFRNFSFEFLFNGVVFIQYWIKILLTQEEFGKLFHVTRQTVSNWENEKSYPDLQILVSMSNQFSSHPVLLKTKQKQCNFHMILYKNYIEIYRIIDMVFLNCM